MTRRETGRAYYNENDPFAANWLRNLIDKNLVAPGDVDERSITDVQPSDLDGYKQHHFFAGIGGWSYALRLAGWPDDRPVWTGSCPCQPFSVVGEKKGTDDKRHLWPDFYRLIRERGPETVFGEQVASKDGLGWLDGVLTDLEASSYACGAVNLCSAGVGSPHLRQRLYWVGHALGEGLERHDRHEPETGQSKEAGPDAETSSGSDLAPGVDALSVLRRDDLHDPRGARVRLSLSADRGVGEEPLRPWEQFDALPCSDGWRRVRSGSFPLAHGLPDRVGRLRGYGNAIDPYLAAEFIRAAATAPLGGRDEDTT